MAAPWGNARFDILSLDVFDTVLLRDPACQSRRFRDSARMMAKRAAASGRKIDPKLIFKARLDAHALAYRAVEAHNPCGDARWEDMQAMMAGALGLSDRLRRELGENELEYEASVLVPNQPLLERVRVLKKSGVRVVALSDIYFSARDLQRLLERVVGKVVFDHVYSSSDFDATKHSGAAFEALTAAEKVPANAFFHCGDHAISDVRNPRAAGFGAAHLPRPLATRLRVKMDAARFRLTGPVALG